MIVYLGFLFSYSGVDFVVMALEIQVFFSVCFLLKCFKVCFLCVVSKLCLLSCFNNFAVMD